MSTTPRLPPGYVLHQGYPPVPAYVHLRHTSGLSPRSSAQAARALQGSWYGCYITHSAQNKAVEPTEGGQPDVEGVTVVAMGRIIGDGGWYFHIADMAVSPDHQRKGLGDAVLKNLLAKIRSVAPVGPDEGYEGDATGKFEPYVSLLADEPGRKLYARNGFVYTEPHSLGMMLPWSNLLSLGEASRPQ